MFRTIVALSMLAVPAAAMAQDANTRTLAEAQATAPEKPVETMAAANTPPQRVRSVTVTGDEKCPQSTGTEVVVCSRIGEGDKFRIPPKFRELPHPAANRSWATRARVVDDVGRTAAGLPDTCSVVGSGGQTGCSAQILRDYAADKRAQQREAESIP
jgi:hypothetical protein